MANAHDDIFLKLKGACIDALESIADSLPDMWAVDSDAIEEGEWESRDGFWSYNSGNVGFCYQGIASSMYYEGHDNPYMRKFIDSLQEDVADAARHTEGCPEGLGDDDAIAWLLENCPELEEDVLEGAQDYPPFVKSSFMLKGEDGYQVESIDGPMELTFSFGYNDDFGYGREWCQGGYYGKEGFGDRPTVYVKIRFTKDDIPWVIERIGEMPGLVKRTPDSVTSPETVHMCAPSLEK